MQCKWVGHNLCIRNAFPRVLLHFFLQLLKLIPTPLPWSTEWSWRSEINLPTLYECINTTLCNSHKCAAEGWERRCLNTLMELKWSYSWKQSCKSILSLYQSLWNLIMEDCDGVETASAQSESSSSKYSSALLCARLMSERREWGIVNGSQNTATFYSVLLLYKICVWQKFFSLKNIYISTVSR